MSEVFLRRGEYRDFLSNPKKVFEGFKRAKFLNDIKKDELVGIKIHFGEKGNKSYIQPPLLRPLANFLKKRGSKPFLFETNTLYRGKRTNSVDHINLAYKHGFGELGLPIIIGDGLKGNDYIEVALNKRHFKNVFLAGTLEDIDFLFVLSHFTAHMLTGFGAAIKNLGMGCASRKGKLSQHSVVSPEIKESDCISCGVCAKICPANAIEKRSDSFFILSESCIGCAQCISACPKGAVKIVWSESYHEIGEKVAEYAYGVQEKVKCAYVNFCLYITKECDCMNTEKEGCVEDLGILYSWDPVSIDKASIDLLINREGKDFLKDIHPQTDYLHHLQYAQSLGLGSLDYKLIEI